MPPGSQKQPCRSLIQQGKDLMLINVLQGIFSATFLGAILRVTTPILLPSLGALISDRAGVINIGLEGIMLSSAFAGAVVGALTQQAWLGFIAGAVAGILMALLLAFFLLQFNYALVLVGVEINILVTS